MNITEVTLFNITENHDIVDLLAEPHFKNKDGSINAYLPIR